MFQMKSEVNFMIFTVEGIMYALAYYLFEVSPGFWELQVSKTCNSDITVSLLTLCRTNQAANPDTGTITTKLCWGSSEAHVNFP